MKGKEIGAGEKKEGRRKGGITDKVICQIQ